MIRKRKEDKRRKKGSKREENKAEKTENFRRKFSLKTFANILIAALWINIIYRIWNTEQDGACLPITEIPKFEPKNLAANSAEITTNYILHKAFYISRVMGSDQRSTFSNLAQVWRYHLDMYKAKFTLRQNALIGENILTFMEMYINLKEKQKSQPSVMDHFWARLASFAGLGPEFKNCLKKISKENRVKNEDKEFWQKLVDGMKLFYNPRWLDDKGKFVKKGKKNFELESKQIEYNFKDSWGPNPIKDSEGNQLYTRHHLATEAYNKNTVKKIPLSLKQKKDPVLYKNEGVSFLSMFLSTKLGNELTFGDHLFSLVVEKMIQHWAVFCHEKSEKKIVGKIENGNGIFEMYRDVEKWSVFFEWIFGGLVMDEFYFQQLDFEVLEKGKELGCAELKECSRYWLGLAKEIWKVV
jgi:hypothetical protein